MATGSLNRTDLHRIHNVVQNTQLSFPKEMVIALLRDEFGRDSYYHYAQDEWGYPLTPDHTDLPLGAGVEDDTTTRLFIGEAFRWDVIFYPAILVRAGGSNYTPISMNRNKETVKYDATRVFDGYGNDTFITTPTHFVLAGAWEGQLNIDILARDILARDDLISICNLIFTDVRFEELLRAGILVKRVSAGGPTETEDRQQEKLYKQSITLEIRSEWRREIPIDSTIDAINLCVEFGRLDQTPPVVAPNLEINTSIALIDQIEDL
jgi:hypothetical protein